MLDWAREALGARFVLAQGITYADQPPRTLERVRAAVDAVPAPFALAALHVMTTLTGSAMLALAVAAGRLDVEGAWAAAHVDEDFQAEVWGRDEEAEAVAHSPDALAVVDADGRFVRANPAAAALCGVAAGAVAGCPSPFPLPPGGEPLPHPAVVEFASTVTRRSAAAVASSTDSPTDNGGLARLTTSPASGISSSVSRSTK